MAIVMHDHHPVASEVPLMMAGGVTGIVLKADIDFKLGVPVAESEGGYEGFAASAERALQCALEEIEASEEAMLAVSASDLVAAKEAGKAAIILGNEGGKLLEGDLSRLEAFYEMGLRELQLAWNHKNHLCVWDGEGLTGFGRDVVREMNRLGMIIDIAHLPADALADVLDLSEHPPVHSHGAAGQQHPIELQKAMAEMGGVLGVHFFHHFIQKEPSAPVGLADLLDQIDYAVEVLGIGQVGLGADFFPTTGGWRPFFEESLGGRAEWGVPDLSHMPDVTLGLVSRGYSDDDIRKILGGNFLRLCEVVL